ncbi:MAG: glycoside hydrolase family 68 protein [Brasilonema angustatum HA4187-MV1]|jgi:beta-fructofuranosidase|nr:glycoside hydrolase family 68 protein [Brasilonema angustatum HA4187-MV1]
MTLTTLTLTTFEKAKRKIGSLKRNLISVNRSLTIPYEKALFLMFEQPKVYKKEALYFHTEYLPFKQIACRSWDPWILKDKNVYRMFFLLGNKFAEPFWVAGSIGYSISYDLKNWIYQGVALNIDDRYEWQNGRLLAGSCYVEDGLYYLFYSASPKSPRLFEEKIGLAISEDSKNWFKLPEPLIVADNINYSSAKELNPFLMPKPEFEHWHFRDPYLYKCPSSELYYIIFSASAAYGHESYRGCVGIAVSEHIQGPYTLMEPILYPKVEGTDEGIFFEIERPQIIFKNNQYYLFGSAWLGTLNPKVIDIYSKAGANDFSLYCYVADKLTGPYLPISSVPVVPGSNRTKLYGTNLMQDDSENWFAYGWYPNSFACEVTPKYQVQWDETAPAIK